MQKILIGSWMPEACYKKYQNEFEFILPDKEKDTFTLEEMTERLGECVGVVSAIGLKKEQIDAAGKLKAIGNFGAGYDKIDVSYATEKKIPVCNSASAPSQTTAEVAFSLLLCAARQIAMYDRKIRKDGWVSLARFPETDETTLEGKTLGIIGFGRIGKTVARMATGFKMNIVYYDVHRADPAAEEECHARYMELEDLIAASDAITMHTFYAPETHHLFSYREFSLMKKTAFFINASRGKCMDEEALVDALKNDRIAGAGLDVYEFEPKISDYLYTCEKVVLTPHIGTQTYGTRIKMGQECIDGMIACIHGERPYNVVNKEIYKDQEG